MNLADGFPLITTKKIPFRLVKEELLFFIRGERNLRSLLLRNVHIWDEWPFQRFLKANGLEKYYPKYSLPWEDFKNSYVDRVKNDIDFAQQWGDLGPIYGYQWRNWQGKDGQKIDQLARAINLLKTKPHSRDICVSAWKPEDLEEMVLPPCHVLYQFDIVGDRLCCAMYQRSVDTFLGLPFNIASYALLTHLVGQVAGYEPGELTLYLGDTHIYNNHKDQVKEQLTREPRPLPKLLLAPTATDIDNIPSDNVGLAGYNPHESIQGAISV